MQFKIPASENEKKLVHQKVSELVSQLDSCQEKVRDLAAVLDENFLAIDKEYKMELSKKFAEIGAYFWEIHTKIYTMKDNPERFVSKEM